MIIQNFPTKQSGIKLNLGCGNDIIDGYINLDILPLSDKVKRGDFNNLDSAGIQNESCNTILANNIIENIPVKNISKTIAHWISKLEKGGEIYIESIDYNILGNLMAFEQIQIVDINNILYPEKTMVKGLYNMFAIESLLRQSGLDIMYKGFREFNFYIRAIKNA